MVASKDSCVRRKGSVPTYRHGPGRRSARLSVVHAMLDGPIKKTCFGQEPSLEATVIRKNLKTNTDQDPAPYLGMKRHGATAEDVYRKARGDGFKNYECLVLKWGWLTLSLMTHEKLCIRLLSRARYAW